MTETLAVLYFACTAANVLNLYRIIKDKTAKGVSLISAGIFALTTVIQAIYFFTTPETTLFVSAAATAVVNVAWLVTALYFRLLDEVFGFIDNIPLDF